MLRRRLPGFIPVTLALLVLAGLLAGLFLVGNSPAARAAPAVQQPPPVRVECGPPSVPGDEWVVVTEYLAWSGCQSWECWSNWIRNDPSNALMEKKARPPFTGHGRPDPGQPWPPFGYIFDGRATCADGEKARGQWYHNGHARPYFHWIRSPDEPPYLMCEWRIDPPAKQSWSFGESDSCPVCEPDPAATPPATVCSDHPLYEPTIPPPTPVAVVLNPPDVQAMAYVQSSQFGGGAWYPTDPGKGFFYWPFGHYLGIRFSGRISEPAAGCIASSEITRYLFEGAGDRDVCAMGHSLPRPAQTACLDPAGCCDWNDAGAAMHLLFRQNEQPYPTAQGGSLFFWGKIPGPVELRYKVEVLSTYFCTGDPTTRQVVWYFDKSLTMYLTTPAQKGR